MAVTSDRFQFQGAFSNMWRVGATVDFAEAATGAGTFASVDVTVPGVALGDIVFPVSLGVDTVDTVVVGAVTAANTVTLTLLNNTAGGVNLASTTAKFIVARPVFS
jgi:hypothetical protein